MSLVDDVRSACAWVAECASSVRIEVERIEPYSRSLPVSAADRGPDPEIDVLAGPREARAAYALTLNAINFGSGWWPEIRKRPNSSGFTTMALGLRERFDERGPWGARELSAITATELAGVLGQDPQHELMSLYADSLRDLGRRVSTSHRGSFASVADAGGGSAVAVAGQLAAWECFADVSRYRGRSVPFLKRAQLVCADLHHAGVARFGDLDDLTLFADNLIPHVLRIDGLLTYDAGLLARIDAGELLTHGSEEEVEIRACAVAVVELLTRIRPELSAQALDHLLWNRGRAERYKSRPRHRARSTAY